MRKYIVLAIIIIAALGVFIGGRELGKQISVTPSGGVAINVMPAKMAISDLAREAQTIVIGKVERKLPSIKAEKTSEGCGVFTDVIITPERYVKSPQTDESVVVRLLGGRVDDMDVTVKPEVKLQPGERVLLFLKKHPSDQHWRVIGYSQGKYALYRGKAKNDWQEVDEAMLLREIRDAK